MVWVIWYVSPKRAKKIQSPKSIHPCRMSEQFVVVICGPSGVGKSSVISMLQRVFPDKIGLVVPHTSRKPRRDEIDGLNFHFTSKDEIRDDIYHRSTKYLHVSEINSNFVGTRLDSIESVYYFGKRICLIKMDVKSAQLLKLCKFRAKYLYIMPTSIENLEMRIRLRGFDSEEQIKILLHNARKDIGIVSSGASCLDEIVANHGLNAYEDVVDCLKKWFPFCDIFRDMRFPKLPCSLPRSKCLTCRPPLMQCRCIICRKGM